MPFLFSKFKSAFISNNQFRQVGFLTYDLQPFTEDFLHRISIAVDVSIKAYPVCYHSNQKHARIKYYASSIIGKPLSVNVKGSTPEGLTSTINWRAACRCAIESNVIILYGLQGGTALLTALFGTVFCKTIVSVNRTLPVQWEKKRRWWVKLLKLWLLSRCSLHIYQAPVARDVLIEIYGIDEKRLINAPFEAGASQFNALLSKKKELRNSERNSLRITDKVLYLFSGNIAHHKGICPLIDAMALMPKQSDAFCIFAGPGIPYNNGLSSIEHYQRYAKSVGAGDKVLFLDHISHERLACLYWAADVVVLPTLKDCTPKVLVEAALASKPIVTTNVHGWIGSLIKNGENAFVVDPEDTKALHGAMLKLLDQNLRIKMGARSKVLVDQTCNPELETAGFVNAIMRAHKLKRQKL